jgi:hypothetical protein
MLDVYQEGEFLQLEDDRGWPFALKNRLRKEA